MPIARAALIPASNPQRSVRDRALSPRMRDERPADGRRGVRGPERAETDGQPVADHEEEGEDAGEHQGQERQAGGRRGGELPQPVGEQGPLAPAMLDLRRDEAGQAVALAREEEPRILSPQVPEGYRQLLAEAPQVVRIRRVREPGGELGVALQEEDGHRARRQAVGAIVPGGQGALQLADGGLHVLAVAEPHAEGRGVRSPPDHLGHDGIQAGPAGGDGGDHGASQDLGQSLRINPDAAGLGLVHDVQGHHQRDAEVQDLEAQVQVAGQVGGIQHQDDRVGCAVQQGLAGHPLIFRDAAQGVGARQVNDADALVPQPGDGELDLDRLAGIVGRGHAHPGQAVEDAGFPDVRIPGEGDGQLDVRPQFLQGPVTTQGHDRHLSLGIPRAGRGDVTGFRASPAAPAVPVAAGLRLRVATDQDLGGHVAPDGVARAAHPHQ